MCRVPLTARAKTIRVSGGRRFTTRYDILLFGVSNLFFFGTVLGLVGRATLMTNSVFTANFDGNRRHFFLPLIGVLEHLGVSHRVLIAITVTVSIQCPFTTRPR